MSKHEQRTTLSARVTVSLLVADMKETITFYERLGFHVTGRHEDAWAEASRDHATLQFFTEPPQGVANKPGLSGTIYFYPTDVSALAAEWRNVISLEWGPEEMPYGMREFGIKDPNGYFLAFTEPVD